jgi:hypothetical protein
VDGAAGGASTETSAGAEPDGAERGSNGVLSDGSVAVFERVGHQYQTSPPRSKPHRDCK